MGYKYNKSETYDVLGIKLYVVLSILYDIVEQFSFIY